MDLQKAIILAVDDQPAILHTVAMELREGYQIRPFTSGQTALKYLDTQTADLILLDYDMPEMNGCEVLKRLRDDKRHHDIPVIFLTGSENGEKEAELLEKGASDYIRKPIKSRVLQTRVRMQVELSNYRNRMEALVSERTEQLKLANEKLKLREEVTLNLLAEATDLRDHDTGGHINRTTEMVRIMVRELMRKPINGYTLSDEEAEDMIKSAKLHDLGKIAVPDSILLKPGKLDSGEFSIIMGHPAHGAGLLEKYILRLGEESFLNTARNIALFHHERWDGTGYPKGLKGEAIPLCARITAIADVYDALISERPYKKPFAPEKAVEIIKEESGTHFDPNLVEIFIKLKQEFMALPH